MTLFLWVGMAGVLSERGFTLAPVVILDVCSGSYSARILAKDDQRPISAFMPCRVGIYQTSRGEVSQEAAKMKTLIAEELESEELYRFHDDFRRALLMHRKACLNLFFRLQFPLEDRSLYEGVSGLKDLDFVRWLADPPAEIIIRHPVYRELITRQERLIRLAQELLNSLGNGAPRPGPYANLLHAMHEFDRGADRLDAGITTSLTDLDELTGLLNRKALERDLEREHAHASIMKDCYRLRPAGNNHALRLRLPYLRVHLA